jgi:anti-anti-sigma factor
MLARPGLRRPGGILEQEISMHNETTTGARLFSRRTPGHTVLTVCGELDIVTTAALRDQILILIGDTTAPLIIDLSAVTFCDASGLAMLVGAQRRARLRGITVALAGPPRRVSKLLRITGLDRSFTIYPSLAAARLGSGTEHPAVA